MTHQNLPEQGRPEAEVLEDLKRFAANDPDYRNGRTWSLVYHIDEAHDDFAAAAYRQYSSANGLNPAAFLHRYMTKARCQFIPQS